MYIVIMNNVFKDFKVDEFFDLKGSTFGRNLLRDDEPLSIRESKYGKTAMKDLDFLRFFRDTVTLDENDAEVQQLLNKKKTFREVVEKDCNFFGKARIIDYSLLLGKIKSVDEVGNPSLDQLFEDL